MSAKEILLRIARLRGHRPITFSVPILSPRLSSYWLKLITGADYYVARQLVEGLSTDLVSSSPEFWGYLPNTGVSHSTTPPGERWPRRDSREVSRRPSAGIRRPAK